MESPLAFVLLALAIHPPPAAPPRPVATPEARAAAVQIKPQQATCDAGRTPIAAPTTITKPGSYYLVADIASTEGSAIVILADNVTLDLNGHRVSAPIALGVAAVRIEDGAEETLIRNGRIFGGQYPLHARSTAGHAKLRLDAVDVLNTLNDQADAAGVRIEGAESVEIVASTIEAARQPLSISGNFFQFSLLRSRILMTWSGQAIALNDVGGGLMEGNEITSKCPSGSINAAGALFVRGKALAIRGNSFWASNCDTSGDGITLSGIQNSSAPTQFIFEDNIISSYHLNSLSVYSNGNIVRGNSILGRQETGLIVTGSFNEIRGNQVSGSAPAGGISIAGSANLVQGNTVSNSFTGIVATGTDHLIEGNQINCYNGLRLGGSRIVYRNNVVWGQNPPILDEGTGNIDAGGNVASP